MKITVVLLTIIFSVSTQIHAENINKLLDSVGKVTQKRMGVDINSPSAKLHRQIAIDSVLGRSVDLSKLTNTQRKQVKAIRHEIYIKKSEIDRRREELPEAQASFFNN